MATVLSGRARRRLLCAPVVLGAALAGAQGGNGLPQEREPPLRVTVTPPLDPLGRPWRLATAPQQVHVFDQAGTRWLTHALDANRASDRLELHVPRLLVAGQLWLGTQPVSARLIFTSGQDRRVAMETTAAGRFRGALPVLESGEWDLEVRGSRPALRRRVPAVLGAGARPEATLWLDVDLGHAGVTGCVSTAAGRPQPGVLVRGENVADGTPAQSLTDRDGCFDLGAVAPGSYRIWAESVHGYSAPERVEVDERGAAQLRLVLKPLRRLAGRVVADTGPVAGASVQTWLPPGVPRGDVTTTEEGGFEQDLPTDDAEIGVTAIAPGHAITMTRLWLNGWEPLEIALSNEAGVLIVEAPNRSATDSDQRGVVLGHDGSIELLEYLGQWGTVQERAGGRRRVIVPGMAPGHYVACLVEVSERASVWQGTPHPGCASGTLAAGGRLTLELGPPSERGVSLQAIPAGAGERARSPSTDPGSASRAASAPSSR